jgi:hypothetical protein
LLLGDPDGILWKIFSAESEALLVGLSVGEALPLNSTLGVMLLLGDADGILWEIFLGESEELLVGLAVGEALRLFGSFSSNRSKFCTTH